MDDVGRPERVDRVRVTWDGGFLHQCDHDEHQAGQAAGRRPDDDVETFPLRQDGVCRWLHESPYLKGQRGPLRFVIHAIAAHWDHVDELDVPLPRRADHESRDALRIAARPSFWNRHGIAFSSGDDELLGNRLAIHETPEQERIAHNNQIGIRERYDLRRVSQNDFERSRPQIADLENRLDVLLVAFARRASQLPSASTRIEYFRDAVFP